jgi:hypothetical protein
LDLLGSLAHEPPPALRFGLGSAPVRSHGLAPIADLEHVGFLPPILHGVKREGRWPFSAAGSGSLPASGGYGFSAEAQLHRYSLIRNIQGGSGERRAFGAREETSSPKMLKHLPRSVTLNGKYLARFLPDKSVRSTVERQFLTLHKAMSLMIFVSIGQSEFAEERRRPVTP